MKEQIIIRYATIEDAQALADFLNELRPASASVSLVSFKLKSGVERVAIALYNQTVIGYCSALIVTSISQPTMRAYITDIFVNTCELKHDITQRLLFTVEQCARQLSIQDVLLLPTLKDAQRYGYERTTHAICYKRVM